MKILKRNGKLQEISFDKIQKRLKLGQKQLNLYSKLKIDEICTQIISGLFDGISSTEIDEQSARILASWTHLHPDYSRLAAYIHITRHHKITNKCVLKTYKQLNDTEILDPEFFSFIKENYEQLNKMIVWDRDLNFDYFGLSTLFASYLLKDLSDKPIERPQHLYLRVAWCVSNKSLSDIKEIYDLLSEHYYTHATPTLFNAGTAIGQLSSCFLIDNFGDDIDGIFDTKKEVVKISKSAGGIGLAIHNVRASGSHIYGTGGKSSGIMPMLKSYNEDAKWINQGGKRPGSFAMWLEPWHLDILTFIDAKKNHGKEEFRARDLFYGLWMCNLFYEFVEQDRDWYLFCPNELIRAGITPLYEIYGDRFNEQYFEAIKLADSGKLRHKKIPAKDLLYKITISQAETSVPYMVNKDWSNQFSNQKNLGTIKSSNLCFTGDTQVLLSDGSYETIKNLSDKKEKFFIKSYKTEKTLSSAYCTGNEFTLELTLSNGSKINCTPEHRLAIVNPKSISDSIEDIQWVEAYKCLYQTLKSLDDTKTLSVLKIKKIPNKKLVYDLRVPETECFYIKQGESNILVHNCTEIIEYSDSEETAVCNLASIALNKFVENGKFNFTKFSVVIKRVVRSLNNVIDNTNYPTENSRRSNLSSRPMGIGVQGLADTYALCGFGFDDPRAFELNKQIFEWIYFYSLESSMEQSKESGSYEKFVGSDLYNGKFHWEWYCSENELCGLLDWNKLKIDISKWGIRNSLFVAPMPTASTAQIMGNNECFEPFTDLIYTRNVKSGEYTIINKHLVRDLIELDLWNEQLPNAIIMNRGSIRGFGFPEWLQNKYKTVWEISQKVLLNQAADRQRFIDQSQSLNLFLADPKPSQIIGMHLMSWKLKLKTQQYYLRRRAKIESDRTLGIDCFNCGS